MAQRATPSPEGMGDGTFETMTANAAVTKYCVRDGLRLVPVMRSGCPAA